ncbi:retrotransposon protein, putative, ty1-copia subclass [Tanacetum coccineum]
MIMISMMRDKINSRKKRLNREEAKGQEQINRLEGATDFVLLFSVRIIKPILPGSGNFLKGINGKKAIKSEIDSILQNHTWELVDLPPGCKPLGYKWIFKKKMKADGTIDKYKARLVIKGYDKMKFDMKDIGLDDVIIGIKIIRNPNGLVLSQAHYVDKILNTHNAGDSDLARTPIDTSMHLSKNRGVVRIDLEYAVRKK